MTVDVVQTKFLSLTECGARIGKCEATVRNMIGAGKLKAGRLRGRLVVHEDEVARYLAKQREPAERAAVPA